MSANLGSGFSGVDVQTWVVLAVGIATVIAQVWAARTGDGTAVRQAHAAELQAKASQAALDRELSALLIATRAGASADVGYVKLHNGGQHVATNVRLAVIKADGTAFGEAWQPMVRPGGDPGKFPIRYKQGDHGRFNECELVDVSWEDGRGPCEARLRLLG